MTQTAFSPHLLSQKLSQSALQRPSLPHSLLDEASGLLTSREPLCLLLQASTPRPLQRHLVTYLLPKTWLPALAKLGNTRSPAQSPDCLCVSLHSQSEHQANEQKWLGLGMTCGKLASRAAMQWGGGIWAMMGSSSVLHLLWCHMGLSLLWKHLQLSRILTCTSSQEEIFISVAFLSFTLSFPMEAIGPCCWDHFMARSSPSFRHQSNTTSRMRSSTSIPL